MNIIEVTFKNDLRNIVMSLYEFSYDFEAIHSETCRIEALGDYSSAVALGLGKKIKRNPREVSQEIVEALRGTGRYSKINVSGSGFINVTGVASSLDSLVSFDGIELPKLKCQRMGSGSERSEPDPMRSKNALKRVKNIRHILNTEGINCLKNTEIVALGSQIFEAMYLSSYYKKMNERINALRYYDEQRVKESVYLKTLQELLECFEQVEKVVVYRKYSKDELRIIEKIYFEFQQIFDKIL